MKRSWYRPQLEPLEDRLALTSAATLPPALPLTFGAQQQSVTSPVPLEVTLTPGQFYAVHTDGTVHAVTGALLRALQDGDQVSLTRQHALAFFGFENGRFELITDTHTAVRTQHRGTTMFFQASGAGLTADNPSTQTQTPQPNSSVVVDVAGNPAAGQINLSITPAATTVTQPASLPGTNYLIVAVLLPASVPQGQSSSNSSQATTPPAAGFALFQPRTQGQAGNVGSSEEGQPGQELEVAVEVQTDNDRLARLAAVQHGRGPDAGQTPLERAGPRQDPGWD